MAAAAKGRPRSACSGHRQNGAEGDTSLGKSGEPNSAANIPSSSNAISRLANRITSSAGAMGRRALRTALHRPGLQEGGRLAKVSLDTEQPELDVDSFDG